MTDNKTFTMTLFTYPNGIEGESMDCEYEDFTSIEDAIDYAHKNNGGLEFAGIQIEDELGNLIYEITESQHITDNRVKE